MTSGAVFPKNRVTAGLMLLWVILGTSACSGDSGKANKSSPVSDLFKDGNVPTIKIEIPRAGIETLRKYRWRRGGGNEQERVDVSATVKEGAQTYTNVAVHLKGAAGSFRPVDQNPGLTLKFDKWADGQRFHGLQKLSLANALQDPTFVSDKLCRELYLKAGVPAPRAGHARVYLNGRDLGLHVLTEGWNKQFLHRHFENTKGNLYDCSFAHDINSELEVNSGDKEDKSDLVALVDAAKEAAKRKKLDPLTPVLDVDRFLRLLVMDGLLWNWDGYAIGHNNYRVFHDLDSDKMIFMPHGLDQMFWRADGPIMPEGKGLVAHAVLASPEGRKRYLEYTRKFMADFFNSTALTDRVREISASIEPALSDIGHSAVERQHEAAEQFCRMIILRVASLRSQLAGSSNLLTVAIGQSVPLTNWLGDSGAPSVKAPATLHLVASPDKALDFAQKTVWLEAGYYTVEGRVKTKGVKTQSGDESAGAGFRVISQRKPSLGVQWDWFPYRESRDYDKRAEMIPPGGRNDRLAATSEWTPISYDFDLRQPMADVHVFCELRAEKGEAWFDPASIRLVRRASSKLPAQKN